MERLLFPSLKGHLQSYLTRRNLFFVIGRQRSRYGFDPTLPIGGPRIMVLEFPASLLCSQGWAMDCPRMQTSGLVLNILATWFCSTTVDGDNSGIAATWLHGVGLGGDGECIEFEFSWWSVPLINVLILLATLDNDIDPLFPELLYLWVFLKIEGKEVPQGVPNLFFVKTFLFLSFFIYRCHFYSLLYCGKYNIFKMWVPYFQLNQQISIVIYIAFVKTLD